MAKGQVHGPVRYGFPPTGPVSCLGVALVSIGGSLQNVREGRGLGEGFRKNQDT